MPPSQLKRLKTSLREAGVTGPPKSKKQKTSAKCSTANNHNRRETLQHLRDSFNPFEFRAASSRPAKHQHVTNGYAPKKYKDVLHRPGVTKSAGEEMRRAKLLPELQRRNKVGGLVDRRIGEGDGGMTAQDKAVQRFAVEKGRKRGRSLFDLEGSDDEVGVGVGLKLTHGGRGLDELPGDDFGEGSEGDGELVKRKRQRSESEEDDNVEEVGGKEAELPERKKSKKEVMDEVIGKSKFHKYERQKAKEDDDDLREELDKGMDDMLALLRGHKAPQPPPKPSEPATNGAGPMMNPDRLKLLEGMDRDQADREYDARLRQYAQDAKAKPSERTKTDEEKIQEKAERLKDLEDRRLKRMRGDEMSDVDEEIAEAGEGEADDGFQDEATQFGFKASEVPRERQGTEQVVLEGEDEFELDEDLVASGSDIDVSDAESQSENGEQESHSEQPGLDDEEDEFVKDILGDVKEAAAAKVNGTALAYTYPCPRSHKELLDVIKDKPIEQLPTVIQRIRALHHPSLSGGNKEGMADFSAVLVEYLSYMGLHQQSLHITEQVIRHLHSLSRTYPERIAQAFRAQLKAAHERRELHAGDLIILTAIGSIYPTSDHWHQVVTPAMTLMARWLGMNALDSREEGGRKGVFLVALCVKFQSLSKRVVPEALRFTLRALSVKDGLGEEEKKVHAENLMAMAELWKEKSAFIEMFTPALALLKRASAKREPQSLQIMLEQSRLRRRPLELHHHRPLPIRTQIPKFEEGFNPDKHYDPDHERSASKKLHKEYKRERKGALRELRKDANFIAREKLREKREKDEEYDRRYRRLVAEVQGEAGHDAKEYRREKARDRNKKAGRGRR